MVENFRMAFFWGWGVSGFDFIRTFFGLLEDLRDLLELLAAILEVRAFLAEETGFIWFQGGDRVRLNCFIRPFSSLLDNLRDLLELLTAIFENRSHLLEDPRNILEDQRYIRTFSVLLELPARILELFAHPHAATPQKKPTPRFHQSVREPTSYFKSFNIVNSDCFASSNCSCACPCCSALSAS